MVQYITIDNRTIHEIDCNLSSVFIGIILSCNRTELDNNTVYGLVLYEDLLVLTVEFSVTIEDYELIREQ